MKTLKFLAALTALMAFTSYSQVQHSLVATRINSQSVLVSSEKDTVDNAVTQYSGAISGSALNGRKIVVQIAVTDTASSAQTAETFDVLLQASLDGTNYVTIATPLDNKDFSTTSAGVALAAASRIYVATVDLSSYYGIPYYRLAFAPNSDLDTGGRYKFTITGAP